MLSSLFLQQQPVTLKLTEAEVPLFAKELVAGLQPGDWLLLDGEIGAGKTALMNALFKEYGIEKPPGSPTFAITHIVEGLKSPTGVLRAVHGDLYRVNKGSELQFLGLELEFNPHNTLACFEWPFQVDTDDWENLFSLTGCPVPTRVLLLCIENSSDNEKRNYTISFSDL